MQKRKRRDERGTRYGSTKCPYCGATVQTRRLKQHIKSACLPLFRGQH